MAKAGEKSGGGGKGGLKRKATAEEPQEAASDGTAESGTQPAKAAAFPPGFSISEIKNKQRRHLMFTRWKQQQRKVRARDSAGSGDARRAGGARGRCVRVSSLACGVSSVSLLRLSLARGCRPLPAPWVALFGRVLEQTAHPLAPEGGRLCAGCL